MTPVSGPTLADIARAAEVSTATVSHALNGTGRVGEATRRRVREVATGLGYGPPRAPVTRTLGLAVTTYAGVAWNLTDIPFFSRAITAATAAAHQHGYALTTLPTARGAESLWHTLAVDGMLIMDSPVGDPVLRALRARGVPLVFDGVPGDALPGDLWVDNDHAATTREVLDHLAATGAERVALHAGYGRDHYTSAATEAYEQWCAERRRRPLPVTFDPADSAGRAFDPLLGAADPELRPDAVYSLYDPGGRQVLAAAARHRLAVPGRLRLVCASEDPGYAETDPPVSTVTLRPEVTAATAVTLLARLVDSGPAYEHAEIPRPVVVPAALRVRASSHGAVMY
ncbi:LacI family DNA-binding transcriptional regulator [Streptomyces sp. P9(2023)]|uniref:LacI family DNA-binding transcriptional regulator n=1 Tax=Streptomyces sp. P9(2023) TaxID=3064394 RepID=UPI0028F4107B|nr:LacI family DNA-binding transcriptional regulator [Streptomyces sp. P9(2023)]MDT9690102.1 LacI family DNA-binding transcriptional regulator [Streptomyces sp. P9(2023)]